MRQGVWTNILTPLAALIGAVLVAPRLAGWVVYEPWVDALGVALLACGAGGGLLLRRLHRVGIARLRDSARQLVRQGRLRPVEWPDDHLAPLVTALNECLDLAQRAISDAEARERQMAAELKVTASQQRHAEAVIGAIHDAVLVTDAFDELVLANDAAERLLGLAVDHESRPIDQVIGDAALVALIRQMRQGGTSARRTVEMELAIGETKRPFRVTLGKVADDGESDGEATSSRGCGVVAVLHDISREREVAQAKNDFVGRVSHELRTPLSSIRAYVEMLLDGEAGDEKTRSEFYEIIQAETSRLGAMIDNILNTSRIEAGLYKINRQPQSPMLLADKAVDVMAPQARLKKITLHKELLPTIYQVEADGDLLYQVLLNLLSNAIKYTPDGGRVTLRTEVDEAAGVLRIKVIDTGAGIPEADMPRLFEKFFRVEKNAKLAKGTGLGLPLVKRVIEQDHAGRVFVESVEGRGSTFGFELPLLGYGRVAA